MRTIKFRGRRIDNGKWIYGYYVKFPDGEPMIYSEETQWIGIVIDPETVGQLIEIEDKNKAQIFEGDILKIRVQRYYNGQARRYNNVNHSKTQKGHYLNAEVLNARGILEYNREHVEKLEEPIGRERVSQDVMYDRDLFDTYSCKTFDRDEDGKPIKDPDDEMGNILWYLDIEVIGNKSEDPELLN